MSNIQTMTAANIVLHQRSWRGGSFVRFISRTPLDQMLQNNAATLTPGSKNTLSLYHTFKSSLCCDNVLRSFPIGSMESTSLSRKSIQFFTACKLTRHPASSPALFCSSSQILSFILRIKGKKKKKSLPLFPYHSQFFYQ